jgi:thioredoxin 2
MAPEFESAAEELEGRVRFVKLDTDRDEAMAARLQIQGLPTLLFLDKYDGDEDGAKAVLKGRIEGALRQTDIVSLCEHYYFGAPAPELF